MRRILVIALALLAAGARAADAVAPASCTITNVRGEALEYVSDETYYEDTTLRLTNCVIYAGTSTNSAVQGLDGVTVQVSVGNTTTNIDYTATVQSAEAGSWWCDIVVPSFTPSPYLQIKVTDASTNSYIYPWKMIRTKDSL